MLNQHWIDVELTLFQCYVPAGNTQWFSQRITRTLCRCTCWSRSLLFSHAQTLFSWCGSDMMHNMGIELLCHKQGRPRSACTSMQSDLGFFYLSTYTTIFIDSVSRQWRPRPGWSRPAAWSWPALSANCIRTLFVHYSSYGSYSDSKSTEFI